MALDSTRPLEILRRARHVLSETKRVERAAAALEAGKLDEVGALMNESHRSLAEDFEVSTPRLDAMVECARRAGALGARLTGAGFGGSIIALCAASEAPGVIAALDQRILRAAQFERSRSRSVARRAARRPRRQHDRARRGVIASEFGPAVASRGHLLLECGERGMRFFAAAQNDVNCYLWHESGKPSTSF